MASWIAVIALLSGVSAIAMYYAAKVYNRPQPMYTAIGLLLGPVALLLLLSDHVLAGREVRLGRSRGP